MSICPSFTGNDSSTRSCNSGFAPSEYLRMNPAGDAAATCIPAAKAGAPVQECGARRRLYGEAMDGDPFCEMVVRQVEKGETYHSCFAPLVTANLVLREWDRVFRNEMLAPEKRRRFVK